ncbi:hypothetical protein B551_0204530 [Cupriavidus sp. HPC(L)]|nr:hypothetical protein B551_0204530 [Cupriavidus sp. HPC(L)]
MPANPSSPRTRGPSDFQRRWVPAFAGTTSRPIVFIALEAQAAAPASIRRRRAPARHRPAARRNGSRRLPGTAARRCLGPAGARRR